MGKANRRYHREKNRKQVAQETKMQNNEKRAYEERLTALMNQESYGEALGVIAEMVEHQACDAEDMYRAAYCYFMTGDYRRAAQWLTNTLSFAPAHVEARLLLARICILEDRADDGMAIYDFLLEHYPQQLQPEQREDMQDILEYYVEEDKARICEKFPYVAEFMHLDGAETTPAPKATADVCVEAPAGADVHVSVASGTQQAEVQLPQPGAPAAKAAEAPEATEASIQQEAEAQLDRVRAMANEVSVAERIRILNAFAGGYFVADEFAAAKLFLAGALELDTKNDTTLRNLAMLTKAQGDAEKALQFASAMHTTDFVLLQALKA